MKPFREPDQSLLGVVSSCALAGKDDRRGRCSQKLPLHAAADAVLCHRLWDRAVRDLESKGRVAAYEI